MREILNDLLEHGVSVFLLTTSRSFDSGYRACYETELKKEHNGTLIKVEHHAEDAEESLRGAYQKFCDLVGHGKPELYKPLLSPPSLSPLNQEIDDEIPF